MPETNVDSKPRPSPFGLSPGYAQQLRLQRRFEQAAELACEVDRDAGVDGALLVEEALHSGDAEHPFVPDVRMQVESLAAVEAEAHEALRPDIIAGKRERHDEGRRIEREKELPAVGMVIRVPEEDPLRVAPVSRVGSGWIGRIGQDVLAADRIVAAEQYVAAPPADEHAFDRAALIAGLRVDRTPALRRPAHDLDRAPMGIVDELAI